MEDRSVEEKRNIKRGIVIALASVSIALLIVVIINLTSKTDNVQVYLPTKTERLEYALKERFFKYKRISRLKHAC